MKKKHIKFLKKIVETPSPTGCEVPVADLVRERLAPIADAIHTDTMGSVHATYEGQLHLSPEPYGGDADGMDEDSLAKAAFKEGFAEGFAEAAFQSGARADAADGTLGERGGLYGQYGQYGEPHLQEAEGEVVSLDDMMASELPLTLMLAAHMDEIGLMVTYISDEGFLSVAAIGGVDAAILPGMRVDVHTAEGPLRGVVGRKPIHLIEADERKSVTPLDKLVIDLGLPAKAVKRKVKVGDPITLSVGFERFGKDMAVSRAFDDKVGVFIACRVMENLAEKTDYAGNFVAAITVQEEIGTRGAMTSAHAVRPDVALAFDVTHATDYPGIDKAKHGNIVCGGGPVIARGPNINPVVFERLVKAAEDEGIPYQLEAEPSVTGTDARAIQVTRDGIPTGLVSIPLRYMHTPTEVISLDDVSATVRLITRFAADLDEAADFVPGHADDYESIERLESEPYADDYEVLIDEVVRLSEEVADLQALAGIEPSGASEWLERDSYDTYGAYGSYAGEGFSRMGEAPISPADAPFGRQQSMLSAEFASLDLDAKPTGTVGYGAGAGAGAGGAAGAAGAGAGLGAAQGAAETGAVQNAGAYAAGGYAPAGEQTPSQVTPNYSYYDYDEAPAAYTEDGRDVPAIKLQFEEEAYDVDFDDDDEEAGASEAGATGDGTVSVPIVMVDNSEAEDDE